MTTRLNWHQEPSSHAWTHAAADDSERYYANAAGLTPQQVADAFLVGYELHGELDTGKPVTFSLEDRDGKALGQYQGRPGEPAQRVDPH